MRSYGNFDSEDLHRAKVILSVLKRKKLIEKTTRHLDDPLKFKDVNDHFHSEYLEYLRAYGDSDHVGMRNELVDISNMVDILFMVLLREEAK